METVKTITLPVSFYTNEHADNPDSVTLSFTQAEIDRIKHLQAIAEKENVSIRMSVDADELDPHGDWRIGYECLIIYSNDSLVYYAQNYYDSAIQFETETFSINLLTTTANEAQS